jgi:putative peptide zinc metalloprotease protein
MTATADETLVLRPREPVLDRAEGIELLGDVHGSGYKDGAALVRRADGQVVQLGPLMYALLDEMDGRRNIAELAHALCERLGRTCDEEHVVRLAEKLAAQGLLAGHEDNAPPRRNPLLALRWKVLVTDPKWTLRLTRPFTFLYRPWIAWPIVAAFAGVIWFVLFHKGVASATSQAFDRPGLLLLVVGLAIASAGFHELGHAAACRYGGATPGGMGMGLYLVWPAFYTDVTDAYRLPRRDRLRVDLGGIYFNAIIAVATLAVWLVVRLDALFLLIALQLLIMVKNLSPVIRSDGYHILSDLTGIPDLYAHIGPTMRRLLPWRRREPSALTGRARALVTVWVLVVVPVLLAMMLGAVILLPRMVATAWDSGRTISHAIPHEGGMGIAASLLRLFALSLPAVASLLITQRLVRGALRKGWSWSDGRPQRQVLVVVVAAGVACCAGWAWWPAGQYQAVQPYEHATLTNVGNIVTVARPVQPQPVTLAPGKHLAIAMIPRGGVTKQHPAFFVISTKDGPIALLSNGRRLATAFPFKLPAPPGPGGTQALAVNTTDGGVVYNVAYAIVTVADGSPVTNTNSAFAIASCKACTTVAVSFQIVLVVGQSRQIAPINAAGALNYNCPACVTTALADQIVVTLKSQPTQELIDKLQSALQQLDALSALGANGTPQAIAAAVADVQKQVTDALQESGQLATTTAQTTTTPTTKAATTTTPAATTTVPATTTASTATTTARSTTTTPTTTTTPAATTASTTTAATTTTATTTPTTTTTGP